jgi:hypothetical protein
MGRSGGFGLRLCLSLAAAVGLAQTVCLAFRPNSRQSFDIEHRTFWTSSRVLGTPDPPPPYLAEPVFTKIKFHEPLYLIPEPGSDRFFPKSKKPMYSLRSTVAKSTHWLFTPITFATASFMSSAIMPS